MTSVPLREENKLPHKPSSKDLHRHAAEYHELAAQHHRVAGMCQDCCHDDDAVHHAKEATYHAFHATMHLIEPGSLPETRGKLTKFLFNFHNDATGFLLDDKQQVHFPAHMSELLMKKIAEGEFVTIHGLKHRGSDVLIAVSITTDGGVKIVDSEPAKEHWPQIR
jgi:hypothetical protein